MYRKRLMLVVIFVSLSLSLSIYIHIYTHRSVNISMRMRTITARENKHAENLYSSISLKVYRPLGLVYATCVQLASDIDEQCRLATNGFNSCRVFNSVKQ